MVRGISSALAMVAGLTFIGYAQAPAGISPQVNADRTITLRLRAPNAKEITVSGELDGKQHQMTKGPNGVWTVTVGPLAPDIYTYAFNADGVTALDPQNANTKLGYGSRTRSE